MKLLLKAAALAAVLSASGPALAEQAPGPAAITGRWDAVLTRNGVDIPFRLDLEQKDGELRGVFFNGFEAEPYDGATSASFQNGELTLNIQHYLTTINAKLDDGKLGGTLVAQTREFSAQYGFRAVRHTPDPTLASTKAPSIAGTWIIPLDAPSAKGEKAFRFVVQQRGPEVAAAILRIDGDSGSYSGAFKDGKWVLSHFDGGRPGVIEVTPKADGTLSVRQRIDGLGATPAHDEAGAPAAKIAVSSSGGDYGSPSVSEGRYAATLTAYRAEVAEAKGLPKPDDFLTHTSIRDPNEVFTFNFPDESGKLISNEDPRFKGKVVLAIVTGTWCPNCHDEAQYLVKLDKQYRDKGLAIVALNFEEPEQQATLERQRAFIKKYGVKYTYLLAGAPAEMWEKVPQLNHLDTWPATLFIGRDGKIKAVHSGFASPATGEFHAQLDREFKGRIESLLAEKAPANLAAASTELTARPGLD